MNVVEHDAARSEEVSELRGLVRVLGTYEAQVAAENYLLSTFLYANQGR